MKRKRTFLKGKLKIFFGYAAGVGKTYSMLVEAKGLKDEGRDVVIGFIEEHTSGETRSLAGDIESISEKSIEYKGMCLKEFDVDAAILRKPEVLVVDELAHTNPKGQRHKKRWQDIEEIISAGIDVYTTLNVQQIEGLNDVVDSITSILVRETVPDKIFDNADMVELIDIEPEELIQRFKSGKIYCLEQAQKALDHFFTKGNLYALREIALRRTADRVNFEVENVRLSKRQISVMPTSEQILACISDSEASARVIRTASRMAEAFHSRWIAFYVMTSKVENVNNDVLSSNFNLAKQLGGEVITVYGEDIVHQILEFAKFRNVTKIIIGKNKRKNLIHNFFVRDMADRLLLASAGTDVYVVTGAVKSSHRLAHNVKLKGSLKGNIKAIIIMTISTIISLFLDRIGLKEANIIMIYVLGIIIVYMTTSGYLTGIISSIAGVLLFNYLFTSPRYSFQVYDNSYIATFPIMIIVSLIIGTLTNRIQREAKESSYREKRTQILYSISKNLLSAMGKNDVISLGIKYLSTLINRTVVCYVEEGGKLSAPYVYSIDSREEVDVLLSKGEETIAEWSFINKKEAGAGTNTFYGAKGFYMPIKGKNKMLGIIGVACFESFIKPEERFILNTAASQIAIALDRELLAEEQEGSKVEIERERLRSNLLRSISHDLRSPLAGIKGAVSTILENGDYITKENERELLGGVYDDTEWLIRLVENLLSMTRFDEGVMEINKSLEAVEEVVGEAVQRSAKRTSEHNMKISLPDNLIMLEMDGALVEQVIINLIDNAVKFTPKGGNIELRVTEDNRNVFFEVIDSGTGISEEILPFIFDRFFTDGSKISDSRRGIGLGLAICKSIVEAHSGKIEAFNSKDGAVFRFNLPK